MENDNQFIIRFPEELADQLNNYFDAKTQIEPKLSIFPYIEKDQLGEKTVFKINLDGQIRKATVLQLPTIIQTFKTVDKVNFFKSNDINEMIYVHQVNETDVPLEIAKKVQEVKRFDNKKFTKYKAHSGITPSTKYIKQRYFRKKPQIDHSQMKVVENELNIIRQQITAAPRIGEETQQAQKKSKRKYNKKFQ